MTDYIPRINLLNPYYLSDFFNLPRKSQNERGGLLRVAPGESIESIERRLKKTGLYDRFNKFDL
jgi:hypothetical protein